MNRTPTRAGLLAAMDRSLQANPGAAMVPSEAAFAPAGVAELYHNGELVEITPNIIPAAWRSQLLRMGYQQGAQPAAFYVVPFINEVDVEALDTLTAANFDATLDEFIAYDELTRPLWEQDTEADQAIANAGTLAKITVNANGTIWGIVLVTVNTKGAATGYLCAATKFGAKRDVQAGDTLEFKYTMKANLPA